MLHRYAWYRSLADRSHSAAALLGWSNAASEITSILFSREREPFCHRSVSYTTFPYPTGEAPAVAVRALAGDALDI